MATSLACHPFPRDPVRKTLSGSARPGTPAWHALGQATWARGQGAPLACHVPGQAGQAGINASHPVLYVQHGRTRGSYPTTRWEKGEIVVHFYHIPVPREAPAGEYEIEVGIYLLSTLERLPVLGPGGESDRILLGRIWVEE